LLDGRWNRQKRQMGGRAHSATDEEGRAVGRESVCW
jgi:hypothetical protein